jgi:hypothetical protein
VSEWVWIGLSFACCVGIGVCIWVFGRGPDRVVDSREQPRVMAAILVLIFAGLLLALGGLAELVETAPPKQGETQ